MMYRKYQVGFILTRSRTGTGTGAGFVGRRRRRWTTIFGFLLTLLLMSLK
jgi:hypothetical protein